MKRKMKNAALLLSALSVVICFCGCGNEKTEKSENEIRKRWEEAARPRARQSRLEREAVSVVNQIIRENPRKLSGNCTRVKLTEQLSDKKWKGAALLDKGKKLPCYVTESFDGIEVEVEYEEVVAVPVWGW